MAGGHKGRWSWVIKYAPNHFGPRGFSLPQGMKQKPNVINLREIEEMVNKVEGQEKVKGKTKGGKAPGVKREEGKLVIDVTELQRDKVLGTGKITRALVVKARSFSKSAEEKIEAIGGKAIVVGD